MFSVFPISVYDGFCKSEFERSSPSVDSTYLAFDTSVEEQDVADVETCQVLLRDTMTAVQKLYAQMAHLCEEHAELEEDSEGLAIAGCQKAFE